MKPFCWRERARSFLFAFRGGKVLLLTQHNAWLHAAVTIAVVIAGIFFRLERVEWALIVFAIGLVWTAEAFNTAIEFLADEVSREPRELIGRAKDVAAFGVLVAAAAAVLIGGIVFWPHVVG